MSHAPPRLPAPDQTFHEHGAAISLDAGGRLGLVNGGLRVGGDEIAGERVDVRTGRRTVYLRRTGEGSGSLTVLTAGAAGRELYAVTVERDGRPVDLEVLGAVELGAGVRVPTALAGLARAVRLPLGRRRVVEVEHHLDLRDPANLGAATAFVAGLVGGGPRADAAAAALGLKRRLALAGTAQARLYAASRSTRGIGGHVAGGLRVGASFGGLVSTTRLIAAGGRGSDGIWRTDSACSA